jgi:hypothetical protein
MYSVEHNNALHPTEYMFIVFLLKYFKQNVMSSTKIFLTIQALSIN